MKIYVIFVCILLGLLLCEGAGQNHSVSWGVRSQRDVHLQREVVYKKSRFLQKVTDDYAYEQKNVPYPFIITQVVVTDQYTNGKGGFATLSSGGPGMAFVKLHFTSQRNHGYNFIVDIYGQRGF